jgi:hypothetical protein
LGKSKSPSDTFLCITEGPNAENYLTKPKCNNAVISFSTNYELEILSYIKKKGLLYIKDKAKLEEKLKEYDFTLKSLKFSYLNSNVIDKFLKVNKIDKFVVKPRYFSHSNEGVIMTDDVEYAKREIKKYGVKFPQWIIQNFIESKTEKPHYLKGDLFLVKNLITKEINLYFSKKMMFYGHHKRGEYEIPVKYGETEKLIKSGFNDFEGVSYVDAENYFDKHIKTDYYKKKILPQFKKMCSALAKNISFDEIRCYKKNLICCQYMSIDLIQDNKDKLKLIEVNVVPTNHFSDKEVKRIMSNKEYYNKLKKVYPDLQKNRKYIQDLFDDMLSLTLDTIYPNKYRHELKYLMKS